MVKHPPSITFALSMEKRRIAKRIMRIFAWIVLTPIALFLLLAILIYIPPVQQFAVDRAAQYLTKKTGVRFNVESVRLAFPLDLAIHNVTAVEHNDTLLAAGSLRLNVALLPLFDGRAEVDGIALYRAQVDTRNYIGGAHIAGRIGALQASAKEIDWVKRKVVVDYADLRKSDVVVCLSDTAMDDTTRVKAQWEVSVGRATLRQTKAKVALMAALPQARKGKGSLLERLPATYQPKQMWLAADIAQAALKGGTFNMKTGRYALRSFGVEKSKLAYLNQAPDGVWTRNRQYRPIPAAKERSLRDSIRGAYTYQDNIKGLQAWQPFAAFPKGGGASDMATWLRKGKPLDPNDIALQDVFLQIDTLTYTENVLNANVAHAAFVEKCGLQVKRISGPIYMDQQRLILPNMALHTAHSKVSIGLRFPLSTFDPDSRTKMTLHCDAQLGWQDVKNLGRSYVPRDLLRVYPQTTLRIKGDFSGNLRRFTFGNTTLELPGLIRLQANGTLLNVASTQRSGAINIRSLTTGAGLPRLYKQLAPSAAGSVKLPNRMQASGRVNFKGDNYGFDLRLAVGQGRLSAKGKIDLRAQSYTADLQAQRFPLKVFLPTMGLNDFSGHIVAKGNGYDLISGKAQLKADVSINRFAYGGYDLSGLRFQTLLKGHKALFEAAVNNEIVKGDVKAELMLERLISIKADANIEQADLRRLNVTTDTLSAGGQLHLYASTDRQFKRISANGIADHLFAVSPSRGFSTDDIHFNFKTGTDSTMVGINSGDLRLLLATKGDINRLTPRLARLGTLLTKQIADQKLDQEALKRELPVMDLHIEAGQSNPIGNFLHFNGYTYNKIYVDLHANPTAGVYGTASVGRLSNGGLLLDTIYANLSQDTTGVRMEAFVKNYTKRNPNKFEIRAQGYLLSSGAGLMAQFYDNDGEKGIDVGLKADLVENGLKIMISPEHPVLAYRNFTVNKDNYIFFGNQKEIRANVDLLADDGTGVKLYSAPGDSINDIALSINNLNLGELSTVLPYLPTMGGKLSGDIHILDNHKTYSAMASLQTSNFTYAGTPLGSLGAELMYLPKEKGEHYVEAYVSTNDAEMLSAKGTYAETGGGSFDGTATLEGFPLLFFNSFLDGTEIALRGKANGEVEIKGPLTRPAINGSLTPDSAHIASEVYGFDFKPEQRPIQIVNSKITFANYQLLSTGEAPLVLNGNVDMTNLSKVYLNLGLKTENFELINTRRKTKSLLFGKVFSDINCTIKGPVDGLSVRGDLRILDKTDLTYILRDSPLTASNSLDGLVEFVDFSDTTKAEAAATPDYGVNMVLGISINEDANFHCLLSEDGQSYADLQGGGSLTFRYTPSGEMRLVGKLTAKDGKIKYELPVIPLRTFDLKEGSTITFTGDPTNPTLDIIATERMKTFVSSDEHRRAVVFDVGLKLTKPLDQMGLEFTIEAPEDLAVQNTLASMSKEQRSKAAVAMMATGMFIADNASAGSGFKANNALNAFLQNEIQNIAGKALKTVDISLGVETGTSTVGTVTTDYSFQFAKRFWNDRISVIIGGRVSAGKEADNSAESIINNVSIEYKINPGATRYARIFYERDTTDPLEGLLTKTGIGYAVRKKTDRFGDLFIFWRKKSKDQQPTSKKKQ